MKEGAADIADALLPSEDGAVARALVDLKAKLSTWSTAVANVQGALAAQAAKLADMDSVRQPAQESTDPPDSAEATQEEAAHRESDDGSIERDGAVSVAESTASLLEAGDDGYQARALAAEASPAEAGEGGPIASAMPLVEPAEGFQETAQDPVDEDEALLRTLDERMAEAIRVQFRLFDGRKSIRELIDGYVEEPEEQPKSWWQRVKG